jgi:fructose-1,6-bisphosphatase/inositol monophosphatase family enzyme
MIHRFLPFLKEAGEHALKRQDEADFGSSRLKADDVMQVVTPVDLEISNMFAKFVAYKFGFLNPLIVDEESFKSLGSDPIARIKEAGHSFVIDPIDGTLTYSNGYPMFAISIGVLRNGEPYEGAIYAPAMGLLVYGDENEAVSVSRAFTDAEKRCNISPDDRLAPIFLNETAGLTMGKNWNYREIMSIDTYAGTLKALFAVTGRARGFASFGYLWDLAGVWPIAKHAGMEIRDLDTGKPLKLDDFSDEDLGVHSGTYKIMSREADFEYLKGILNHRNIRW